MADKKEKKNKYKLKRTPVVAVLGHVDHGKTSLLDSIRGTQVQKCEVGGITQNTRAHEIKFQGQQITFIDTPGHEAFSEMRARGANITDIVLLVVAADDGVKPQTKESIKYAKEAGVPIIVAINKIDLPNTDVSKIKNELSQNNVLVEEYGGETQVFEVSAENNKGLEEMLEGILVQAEILELQKGKNKYDVSEAVVLESKLDKNLGAVSFVLVKVGDIKIGDFIIYNGKLSPVRALLDECQSDIEKAKESSPVWVLGCRDVIQTGERIYFAPGEEKAKEIAKQQKEEEKDQLEVEKQTQEEDMEEVDTGSLDDEESYDLNVLAGMLAEEQQNEDIKKLNVVVKTDTQGTLQVVLSELKKLNTPEVEVNVLSEGTGEITRKDILTAKNARGIVIGFQVSIPSELSKIIKQEKVIVRLYDVIYELIDEVSDAMEGMLQPPEVEEEIARALVKKTFVLTDGSIVAGCVVTNGNVIKGYNVWVERNGEEIGRGKIISLKHIKNEVKESAKGSECGILIEPQIELEEGDEIVLFKVVRT
ncbi:translation initiation factor IF-2 [Candidatus Dojkabacteria bacterium]|nr:translation initiation factor IF-2 [Candidatus Dojkabacteria bacterium]